MRRIVNSFDVIFMLVMSMLMFIYVLYRAVTASVTFDEVWTFDLAIKPMHDVMFSPDNFTSANNHILNSLLIKPCLAVFGHQLWVLRLPNVVSYFIFCISALLIMQQVTEKKWLRITVFILLTTQIYLLDFFSLSRGYGIAIAFEMMSLCAMIYFWRQSKSVYLFFAFGAVAVSAYANFTWINFYLPLWGVLNLMLLPKYPLREILRYNVWPFAFATLLSLLSYKPILLLRELDEFKWGANAWIDSMHTFAKDLLYLDDYYLAIVLQVGLMLGAFIIISILWVHRKQTTPQWTNLLFLAAMIGSIIGVSVLQRWILDTMYMDGRKATMYIPLLALLIPCAAELFSPKRMVWAKGLVFALLFMYGLQFTLLHRPSLIREWWFDEHSHEVANYIYKHPIQGKRDIIYDWHYSSALIYYNRFHSHKLLGPCYRYEDSLPTSKVAYYYIMESQLDKVPASYIPLVFFKNKTCLFGSDTTTLPHHFWNEGNPTLEQIKFRYSPTEFAAIK